MSFIVVPIHNLIVTIANRSAALQTLGKRVIESLITTEAAAYISDIQ